MNEYLEKSPEAAILINCVRKDKYRPFIQVIHVESTGSGSLLVSTDGSRLVLLTTEKTITPGEYEPRKDKTGWFFIPADKGTFPDFNRVIPIDSILLEKDFWLGDKDGFSPAVYKLYDLTRAKINVNFLKDFSGQVYDVYGHPDETLRRKKPITLENKQLKIVVMPMDPDK
jgi:hypothetical protein